MACISQFSDFAFYLKNYLMYYVVVVVVLFYVQGKHLRSCPDSQLT